MDTFHESPLSFYRDPPVLRRPGKEVAVEVDGDGDDEDLSSSSSSSGGLDSDELDSDDSSFGDEPVWRTEEEPAQQSGEDGSSVEDDTGDESHSTAQGLGTRPFTWSRSDSLVKVGCLCSRWGIVVRSQSLEQYVGLCNSA